MGPVLLCALGCIVCCCYYCLKYLFKYVFWILGQNSRFLQRNDSTYRLWDSRHDTVATNVQHSTADSTDIDEEQPQAHQEQCIKNVIFL